MVSRLQMVSENGFVLNTNFTKLYGRLDFTCPRHFMEEKTTQEKISIKKSEISLQIESFIYRLKPFVLYRWVSFAVITIIFLIRMFATHKYYYAGYIAGLYIVQCSVLFLSPKIDPDLHGNEVLPGATDAEFKPFIRKLPEFVFWRRAFSASALALFASMLPFDLPVFGPLLALYFLLVCVFTFRTRIAHMIKHKYLPFDLSKP